MNTKVKLMSALLAAIVAMVNVTNVRADNDKVKQYDNPFELVCFDPLFTAGAVLVLECGVPIEPVQTDDTTITVLTVATEKVNTVSNEPSATTSESSDLGNRGNDKDKGHAGEACDKGFCEQGNEGNKGKSN